MSLSFANVRQFYTAKTTPGSGAKWNSFIVELIHQSLPHAVSVEGVPRKKKMSCPGCRVGSRRLRQNPRKAWRSGCVDVFLWWVRVSGLGQCSVCCVSILYGLCAPILITRARVPGVICFYAPSRILKPRELFKRSFHVASWVYFEFIVVEPSFLCFSQCTCTVRLLKSVLRYVTYHSCRAVLT